MFGKEYITGVSRDAIQNWMKLASSIAVYCDGWFTEEQIKQDLRNLMEGIGTATGKPREVVKKYNTFPSPGFDLETLTELEEKDINAERGALGKETLNFGLMRKLRQSAQVCNELIRDAVYGNKPLPWRQLYDLTGEAYHIILGEERTFLNDVKLPE